ncbi:hypothetical protein DPV78_000908 [Talaromyces pinophilus]|nr:hypothetical protein DPV78_000908 [Talaromyces pinophilus]
MAEHTIKNRYEIHKLTAKHLPWAKAIITHSNVFHSPLWPAIYSLNKTQRAYALFSACDYMMAHQIASGLSYGVFDTQYKFKRADSVATGGALYWDAEANPEATGEELLNQMDFPLVSIAMALDQFDPLDEARLGPLVETLPFYADLYHEFDRLDTRQAASWKATAPGQVMLRNGTSTRADYEGAGVMKELAHFLMRRAAEEGFRAISIECLHDAVCHVWMNPPDPYKARLIVQFNINQYKKEDESIPYPNVDQLASRVFVELK